MNETDNTYLVSNLTEMDEDYNSYDKTELVKKAIDGDKNAFSTIFMSTYKRVFLVLRGYFKNDDDICDALQDTYAKAYANIKRLRSPDAFDAWLVKIAQNSARDILAQNREFPAEVREVELDRSFSQEVHLDVAKILATLPKEETDLLVRVYYDGMRVADIARSQHKPFTTVHSQLKKAKQHLKEKLKLMGIDKPIYSGELVSMISVAIRDAIGTQLLSLAVAQEILSLVLDNKTPADIVFQKVLIKRRNSAIKKTAALIVLIAFLTSLLTTFLFRGCHSVNNRNGSTSSMASSSQDSGWKGFWPDLFGNGGSGSPSSNSSSASTSTSASAPSSRPSSSSAPSSGDASSGKGEDKTSSGSSSGLSSGPSSGPSSSASSQVSSSTDWKPGDTSVTSGTAAAMYHNSSFHGGGVGMQGDWMYFGTVFSNDNTIYKVNKKTGERKQVVSGSSQNPHINIVDNTIYYLASNYGNYGYLSKVNTDGTGHQKLCDIKASNLQVFGNTAYFTNTESDSFAGTTIYSYYKFDLTTNKATLLSDKLSSDFVTMTDTKFIYRTDDTSLEYTVKVYDNKTGKLLKDFGRGSYYVYEDLLFVRGLNQTALYDLKNLDKAPQVIDFDVGGLLFYTPYNGGSLSDYDRVYSLTDNTVTKWPMAWSNYYQRDHYATFNDGYVYFVYEDELHRQYPDGTSHQVF